MQKVINTIQLREKLGEILDQIYYRGDKFIVKRKGKYLAAIIPFEEYQKRHEYREQSFAIYQKIWEANKEYSIEEVEKDVANALDEVRLKYSEEKESNI